MELKEQRDKWSDHNITDDEGKKLWGTCRPGCKVKVYWIKEYSEIIDEGYIFTAPGMDAELGDAFIHIPHPQNPEGHGAVDEEYVYVLALMANKYCKRIECI